MYKAADNKAAISKATDNVALMLNVNTGRPLQAQLFEQVRAMIIDGLLTSGTPLPATRALSEQLGISRNTVVLAYDRLLTEGYIESKRSIGTFVSEALPEIGLKSKNDSTPYLKDVSINSDDFAAEKLSESLTDAGSKTDGKSNLAPPTEAATAELDSAIGVEQSQSDLADIDIDFYPGVPDVHAFPLRTWRRILNRKLLQIEDYSIAKTDILGLFELRRAISEHLGPARGILTNADEVVIVSNEQEARALLCQLLLPEGAPAVIESPGSDGMTQLFSHYKTDVYGISVDQDGLQTDKLPTTFTKLPSNRENRGESEPTTAGKPILGMVYVTPSHHFPLGVSLALPRRLQLLEWAKNLNMMIVEDDSTSDFRYSGSPLTALKGLDNRLTGTIDKAHTKENSASQGVDNVMSHQGNVIYLGGFMKSLGIEIGYLVVPTSLIPRLKELKSLAHGAPSWLEQATLAEFIDNGAYDRHLRKLRKKCKEKRDLLISLLKNNFGDDVSLSGIEGGLHLIWHLPENFGTAETISNTMKQKYKLGLYTVQSGGAAVVSDIKFDKQALIFGFSSLTLEDIEDGIIRLALELNGKT